MLDDDWNDGLYPIDGGNEGGIEWGNIPDDLALFRKYGEMIEAIIAYEDANFVELSWQVEAEFAQEFADVWFKAILTRSGMKQRHIIEKQKKKLQTKLTNRVEHFRKNPGEYFQSEQNAEVWRDIYLANCLEMDIVPYVSQLPKPEDFLT